METNKYTNDSIEEAINNIDLSQNPKLEEPFRQYWYIAKCRETLAKKAKELGKSTLTAKIVTLGCQMNARDSEKIAGTLEKIGYKMVENEDADFVLYNTCTVRENANLKVYGNLGHLNKLKRKNPHMMIALCGCMMQEEAVVTKIQKNYKYVDIIFGTHNIFKLAELIQARLDSNSMIVDIWKEAKEIVEDLPSERKFKYKAGVNIMYGCNNFCTYCIVPYVRGRERSREIKDIVREIEGLVADGVVEIMLLGQNVNSYGKNGLEEKTTFAELLKEVEKIEGLKRIRFMTPHPKDFSDDVIEVMKDSKKICKHVHLPVQSGSSEILRKMNRHYTKESYLDLVSRVKAAIPDVGLTTDIIVGFPGETEENFEDTLDVVRKVGYEASFNFIYSKRTGTPAATMENQVPEDVVHERFNRLLETVHETSTVENAKHQGTIQDVLVESVNTHEEGFVSGRLSNNLLVHFKGDPELIGTIVNVRLDEAKGFYYIGELV
ncbi:MAG: tRNA (N6-isopentenyl adenosine(37)-C2)-methylthiotransferase MiaB [bacterium]|nr:tRNA (N6-isopentenyl adenosine(37)-C2)-methylthiotransferase MiaB [bacterium]